MCPAKIGMILVLMPARVKTSVRIGVVDPEPIMGLLSIPLDDQFRRIRPCWWVKTGWIKPCPKLFGLDIVRNELDRRDLWDTIENIPLQLRIEVCVRITTGMRDRHPLAGNFGGRCCRSEEVPLTDSESDDLDTALEVFPFACDLTATVFFVCVERLLSECSAKLVR